MSVTISGLKDFWKLPEGRQLASAAFIVIGILASVVIFLFNRNEKKSDSKDAYYISIINRKDSIISASAALSYNERQRLQRQCDSEKIAERDARIEILEAQYDGAIRNAIEARKVQRRSIKNVNKALKEVAK